MRLAYSCLLLILKCDTQTVVELSASCLSIDNSVKVIPRMILELISYGSILMLSISIISVMECMPCPLVLMAASVMDPHCIAAKSWLNNLPLLWLERLSQLFNDVSVLEGKRTHISHTHTHTNTHTHTERLTDLGILTRGQTDADTHGHAANESHPSSAEQLNRLHGKETPTQPLSRQPWSQHTDT